MFDAARCLLFVACFAACLLFVCSLFAVGCSLRVARCLLLVACCVLLIDCGLLFVVCCSLFAVRCLLCFGDVLCVVCVVRWVLFVEGCLLCV